MSSIKKLAGMTNDELTAAIKLAVQTHCPNIDIPPKYNVLVEAMPLIYGEGMVKGYEYCEATYKQKSEADKITIETLYITISDLQGELRVTKGVSKDIMGQDARIITNLKNELDVVTLAYKNFMLSQSNYR